MTPVPTKTIEKLETRFLQRPSGTTSPLILFEDALGFVSFAAQALAQDDFTKCFEPQKPVLRFDLASSLWSIVIFPLYIVGAVIRYAILLPLRATIAFICSFIFLLLHPMAYYSGSKAFTRFLFLFLLKSWAFSISAVVRHHGKKPELKEPHVFVSNHTSFVDYIILGSHKFPHATVAQQHEGLFYYILHYMLSPIGTMMFQRNDKRDRRSLTAKLREHVRLNRGEPMLIFPEGTCVNNEYTVLFHKGAFELGAKVCPVAIKYNKSVLDPYWNTRHQSFTQHSLYLMTRWFIMADVWWLEPQSIRPNESAIEFAHRVKALISETAGLQNLSWDGYLKNYMAPTELIKLRDTVQTRYGLLFMKRMESEAESQESKGSVDPDESDPASTEPEASTQLNASEVPRQQRTRRAYSEWSASNRPIAREDERRGSLNSVVHPSFPHWMSDNAIVDVKNELLKSAFVPDQEGAAHGFMSHTSASITNMLKSALDGTPSRDATMDTWKHFSKLKGDSGNVARRIENTSWREWSREKVRRPPDEFPPGN